MQDQIDVSEAVAFDNCGMGSSDDIRVGIVNGFGFKNKPITYSMVDGVGLFEGCIVVAEEADLIERQAAAAAVGDNVANSVVISDEGRRWPDALMPYQIRSDLPDQNRVTSAIAHWEANTNMRFVQRTSANSAQYPNYVEFIPATVCSSRVGMEGGRQLIRLAAGCGTGSTIHEIGHAFGLWHEQSREDRDDFVTINWANIEEGKEHNFNQHISDGDDIGAYDYGSIMHYGRFAFSDNNLPTIEPKQAGASIGQRSSLSAGDIAAVHAIYKTWWNNKRVYRTFASHNKENAWAEVEDLGWRRIEPKSRDGVTNMFIALSEASANNIRVNVKADGQFIEVLYA